MATTEEGCPEKGGLSVLRGINKVIRTTNHFERETAKDQASLEHAHQTLGMRFDRKR